MNELSELWTLGTLDELISADGLFSDGDWVESKDQDPHGAVRLLQLADIGDGVFLNKSNRFINDQKFVELKCTELLANDVLIARMPDPLGRACLMPILPQRCITVVDVAVVRPGHQSVKPKWLMYFLNSPTVRQEVELQSSGSTRRRISRGNLSKLELPIPPLPEQKRIADKLDTLLARIDACRDRLDRLPNIIKQFRQSVLAAATSGRLTEEWRCSRNMMINDWKGCKVGDLITAINAGVNVRCSERPPRDGEKGLVKISAVTWGVFNDDESKTLPADSVIPESTRIHTGDFLISRANTLELVGACVLVHEVNRPVYLSDKILRLTMPESFKKWLLYWLRSSKGRQQIEQLASGNQLSMRNLSQVNLRQIRVYLPSEAERNEIVRRVEILFALADRLEARVQTARARIDTLTPATLAKAFRGELVPQDPNDEPASVLLERIRADRAASDSPPRSRRRVTS